MSRSIADALKNITPEQIEEIAARIEFEIKKKEEADKEFYESSSFRVVIEKIKEYLSLEESINDNPYSKFLFDNVSNEEFLKVFNCIFSPSISKIKIIQDRSQDFPMDICFFENLKFIQIHGQGTIHCIERYK